MKRYHAALTGLVLAGCCGDRAQPRGEYLGTAQAASARVEAPPSTVASASVATPVPSAPIVLRERDEAEVDEKTTLAEAIAYALPKMADATDNWDRGSYLLGQWVANHGAWSTLAALPETAHAMVAKDSDGERGKRLCESGTVTTIKALKGSNPKMFWGILAPSETRAVVFLATGDTGRIVDGSAGRVCGVVTGIYHLTLKSGAPFPTPKVVGMFDLPGNRKR